MHDGISWSHNRKPDPAGAAVVAGEYGGEPVEVGIWAWPRDPALPALPTASDPVLLAELFREFGLSEAATLDIRPAGTGPRSMPFSRCTTTAFGGS